MCLHMCLNCLFAIALLASLALLVLLALLASLLCDVHCTVWCAFSVYRDNVCDVHKTNVLIHAFMKDVVKDAL